MNVNEKQFSRKMGQRGYLTDVTVLVRSDSKSCIRFRTVWFSSVSPVKVAAAKAQ